MPKNQPIYGIILLSLSLIFFTGCDKSAYEVPTKIADFKTKFGIPVVSSSMTIKDFFPNHDSSFHINVNSEGYYSFVFSPDNFAFPSAENYINLNDYNLLSSNTLEGIPIDENVAPYTKQFLGIINPEDFNSTQLSGAKLRELHYKGGILTFNIINYYSKKVSLRLRFTSLLKNGQVTEFKLDMNGYTSKTTTYDLTNSILDFRGNGNSYNTIIFSIIIDKVEAGGDAGDISLTSFNFSKQKWSRINAQLGNVTFPINSSNNNLAYQSVSIDPFKNLSNRATFDFEKIQLKSVMSSSYGAPLSVSLNAIQTLDKNGALLGSFNSSQTTTLKKLESPGAAMAPTSVTGIEQDQINNLFSAAPYTFKYALKLNTFGSGTNDFILDTSTIHTNTILEIPLYGKFSDLTIVSQNDNPLYALNSTGAINTAKSYVKFDITNAIPINFDIQITFLDENLRQVYYKGRPYYLFSDDTGDRGDFQALAANVDKDGYSINSTSQATTISFDNSKLSPIVYGAKYLVISATMSSNNGVSPLINNNQRNAVKVRPKDKLDIKISFAIEGTVHPNQE